MADVNNVDEVIEEVNKPLKESIKEKAEKIKDKTNDSFFVKATTSTARAFKTGLDIGTLRGLNHNGKYKLGLGAMGTMAGIGATIGASASAITPDSPVDPLTGAIVGGAIGAAVFPGERNDNRQADERQDECGHAFEQYFMAVEGVTVEVGSQGGQEVVAANVEGLEQMGDHASVTTVGSQQCYQSGCAGDVGDNHEGQQAIAQRGFGFGKEVAVAFLAVVQPGYAILKDA